MINEKYKTVVHYIIDNCENPMKLGAIKLNKILFFSDGDMYLKKQNSITKDEYIKRQFGPVPKNILKVLEELQNENKIIVHKRENQHYNQTIYLSLMPADLSKLSSEEVDIISYNLNSICNDYTAKQISETTHNQIWEMARIGETIPLYTVYANNLGEINETDIEYIEGILK